MKSFADHPVTLKDMIMFGGIVTTFLTVAFGYGKLTEKVDGMDKRLVRIENAVAPHSTAIIQSTTASAGATAQTP